MLQLLHFFNILPEPLVDSPGGGHIWRQNRVFFKGKNYAIMAGSGKGKTTLINIIGGSRLDYRGDAFFDETNIRDITSDNFAQIRAAQISIMHQDLRLFPELTARQNIEMNPQNDRDAVFIEKLAARLGILPQFDNPCFRMSLGQQQRVALIRTLVRPFEWLLLDEPFSHMDAINAKIAMECVAEIATERGAGIIATSLWNNDMFNDFEILEL
ncbi:MAG: ATP-binding cassette domain-containing protein [Bacteroidetes bacterium]|nr:ATP-binding cassette domain-containing protein [Bacteroidota bacterium]